MRILSVNGDRALGALSHKRLLVGLDFDGTLAPIVPDKGLAAMTGRTRRLVRQLAQCYPTAVISGRGQADIRERVAGLPLRAVVGNHGADLGASPGARRQVAAWAQRLTVELADLPGAVVEHKELSIAVHVRGVADEALARARVLAAAAGCHGAEVSPGKLVWNLVPAGAPDKGAALLTLMRRLGCDAALFVGDDVTDEAVFRLTDYRVLGIHVGRRPASPARFALRSQREIDPLLERLIALRVPATLRA